MHEKLETSQLCSHNQMKVPTIVGQAPPEGLSPTPAKTDDYIQLPIYTIMPCALCASSVPSESPATASVPQVRPHQNSLPCQP
jgi:hypothetical protein